MKRYLGHIIRIKLIGLVFLFPLFSSYLFSQEFNFGLTIPQDVTDYWKGKSSASLKFQSGNLLAKVDWSEEDSAVKNQSSCGSCWAFAAVALVENLSDYHNLSEQVIVSCATGSCSGGWYGEALKYIHENGIPPEDCYTYLAENGNCDDGCDNPEYLIKLTEYDYYGRWGLPDDNTIHNLKTLLQTGPVLVSMLVPADGTFTNYTGGIYNYEGSEISSSRGHAVLVVGYDQELEYFKAKNSWSSSWGEAGYFRISYDDVTDDVKFGGYACIASGVYLTQATPVEFASFSANVVKNQVELSWTTESETENYGFDVERSQDGVQFEKIDFIKGFGTTTVPQAYSYTDRVLSEGKYYYRLKQIDFDGRFCYSEILEVVLIPPEKCVLKQNYPNPFNNNTKIYFQIPSQEFATLKIYNLIGKQVKTLLQTTIKAGYHGIVWDGSDSKGQQVNSGVYYYQIMAGDFCSTRRLVYLK